MTPLEKWGIYNPLSNRNIWLHPLWRALMLSWGITEREIINISTTLVNNFCGTRNYKQCHYRCSQTNMNRNRTRTPNSFGKLSFLRDATRNSGRCLCYDKLQLPCLCKWEDAHSDRYNWTRKASHLFHQVSLNNGLDFSWLWSWLLEFEWLKPPFLVVLLMEEPTVEQLDLAWWTLLPTESLCRSRLSAWPAACGEEAMQEQGICRELPPMGDPCWRSLLLKNGVHGTDPYWNSSWRTAVCGRPM